MGSSAAAGTSGIRTFRRIWLPQLVYEAMPWICCGLGVWCLMLRRRHRLVRLRRERRARSAAGRAFPGEAVV